jgi:DNA-binding response OmpR family regulator
MAVTRFPVLLAALTVAEHRLQLLNDLPHLGWRVLIASTAEEIPALAFQHAPDILLFDAGVVTTAIPAIEAMHVPRLMLGAEPERKQRLRLHQEFKVCAWVPLPLDVEMLAAHLSALSFCVSDDARAASAATKPPVSVRAGEEVGEWKLAATTWLLTPPNQQAVQLTQAETTFLATLAGSPGIPVPRRAMISELGHNIDYFDTRRLDTLLSRLRQKVSRDSGMTLPVRSIHSVGYAFAASIMLTD